MISKLKARTQGQINKTNGKIYKLDTAFSNSAVHQEFMNSEQIKARYHTSTRLDAGFDSINILGLDWVVDEYSAGSADGSTADNYLYLVTANSMLFFYKYGFDKECPLEQTGAILPTQPIRFDVNYLTGNIACENRRANGVFKALVA
jgi:hypothetical protein